LFLRRRRISSLSHPSSSECLLAAAAACGVVPAAAPSPWGRRSSLVEHLAARSCADSNRPWKHACQMGHVKERSWASGLAPHFSRKRTWCVPQRRGVCGRFG